MIIIINMMIILIVIIMMIILIVIIIIMESSGEPLVREGGSAPKGGAHSMLCFACTASETLENVFFTYNLLMAWQSTPKVVPRSRISRSAASFS
jgi:hypothetical protein